MSLRRPNRKSRSIKKLRSSFFAPDRSQRPWGQRRTFRIEPLEERQLLAVDMVTSNLDDGSAGTLRTVIAAAASGDTIEFNSGLAQIDLTQGQIEINEDLTIEGPGSSLLTIDQTTSGGSLFQIDATDASDNPVTVSMSGLTLTGGNAGANNGGAIENNGNLLLDNMAIVGNSAEEGGGLSIEPGASATLTDSTLSNNTATDGGAIKNAGTLSVTDGTFSNDTAAGGRWGGAIDNVGVATINGSTFSQNGDRSNYVGYGGAIFSQDMLSVADSTFAGNTGSNGGAIENIGPATIVNCTFSGNVAYQGSAIFDGGGTDTITGSTLSGNSKTTALSAAGGTTNVANTIIAGNTAGGSDPDVSGSFAATDHDLIGLVGDATGFATSGAAASIVAGTDDAVTLGLGSLADNGGPTQTMALLPGSPAIAIGDNAPPSPFAAPSTDQRGDPRLFNGTIDIGAFQTQQPTLFVAGSFFDQTTGEQTPTPSVGDTVNWPASGQFPEVDNLTFGSNAFGGIQAAVAQANSEAETTIDVAAGTYQEAVAINVPLLLNGANMGATTIQAPTTGSGTGLTINAPADSVTVEGFTVTGFSLGASVTGGTAALDDDTITGNTNPSNYGGGVYNSANLTVTGSTISDNSAAVLGGGIYSTGTATVTDSIVTDNSAQDGGGVWSSGVMNMTGCTVASNAASYEAGGILNATVTTAGMMSLVDTTVFGNTAPNSGGGIVNYGQITITSSTISGNTSNVGGGMLTTPSAVANVANTIVAGNILTGDGAFAPDLVGALAASDHNLFGVLDGNASGITTTGPAASIVVGSDDPGTLGLGSLANHGGPTQTVGLLSGSPAIDAGDNAPPAPFPSTPATDQRSAPRIANGTIDIGALETQPTLYVAQSFYDQTIGLSTSSPNPGEIVNWLASGQFAEVDNLVFGFNAFSTIQSAVNMANSAGGNTVDVAAGLYRESVSITQPLTLVGASGSAATVIKAPATGAGAGVTMNVTSDSVSLSDFTVTGFATGVDVVAGNANLMDCTIAGNLGGSGITNQGVLVVSNSTISGNSSRQNGGGIDNLGTLTVADSTISANTAQSGGGIDNESAGTATLINTILAGNTAAGSDPDVAGNIASTDHDLIGIVGDASGFTDGNGNATGGNLVGTAANPLNAMLAPLGNYGGATQTMVLLPLSPALNAGDAAPTSFMLPSIDQRGLPRLVSGTIDIGATEHDDVVTSGADDGSSGTLRTVIDDAAPGDIIEFALPSGTTQISLTQGWIEMNKDLTVDGPGSGSLTVSQNTSNVASLFQIDATDAGGNPVAVSLSGMTLAQPNTSLSFSGNVNFLVVASAIANAGNVSLDDIVMQDNAWEPFYNTGTAELTNCSFLNNSSGIDNAGDLSISDSSLSENRGTALSNSGHATVTACNISDNVESYERPGGVYNTGTMTIVSSTISQNHSTDSYPGGGGIANYGSLTIDSSTVSENTTDNAGGGIYNNYGRLTINGSTISNNSADASGGGIENNGGSLNITNSTISGNAANQTYYSPINGGGIDSEYGEFTIINSTIAGNTAAGSGGGIDNVESFGTVIESTIAGNSAGDQAGGIEGNANDGSSETLLVDTIVAGNLAPGGDPDVQNDFSDAGSLLTGGPSDHDLIGIVGDATGFTTTGAYASLIGTAADPIDAKLGALADNGGPTETMALLPGSPAIDAGDNGTAGFAGLFANLYAYFGVNGSAPTTDERGVTRILDGTVDIGAFESSRVAATASGNYTLKLVPGASPDQTQREIIDPSNNVVFTSPVNVTPALILTNTAGYTLNLTVDYSAGDPIPAGGLTFNGGGNDSLTVTGYSTSTLTDTYIGAHSGSVQVGTGATISYTGLSPLALEGSAANLIVNLPGGATAATFQDDGAAGNGTSQLISTNGAFEGTTFTVPTGALAVNAGAGGDTITVARNFTVDFNANLKLSGGAGDDTFNIYATPVQGATTIAGGGSVKGNVLNDFTANDAEVWSNAGTPPVVTLGSSGEVPITFTSIQQINVTPGNGVLNVYGDNNEPTTSQNDGYRVVGTGPNAFTLAISGNSANAASYSQPLNFSGVRTLNAYGEAKGKTNAHHDANQLAVAPYADNTPQGWGVQTFWDQGNASGGGTLVYNGIAGVSENLTVAPSGAGSGQIFSTNAAGGSTVAIVNYVRSTNLIVNANDGTAGDTDALTLKGANPGASGNAQFTADFAMPGSSGSPLRVSEVANGNRLFTLQSTTNLDSLALVPTGAPSQNSLLVDGYNPGTGQSGVLDAKLTASVEPSSTAAGFVRVFQTQTTVQATQYPELDYSGIGTVSVLRPPALAINGPAVKYDTAGGVIVVAPAATLSTGDGLFAKSSLSVSNINAGADDRLGIQTAGSLKVSGNTVSYNGTSIGTFTGGASTTPLVMSFNVSASEAAILAVVHEITFHNTTANPGSLSNRTINFQLTDGGGNKDVLAVQTVTLGTPPALAINGPAVKYDTASGPIVVAPAATLSAGDGLFAKSLLTVADTNADADDRLAIQTAGSLKVSGNTLSYNGTSIGTFTGGSSSTPLAVSFNASASEAAILAVVHEITFHNTISNPGNLSNRTIDFQLTDGGGNKDAVAAQTVTLVTPPALAINGPAVTYPTGGAAVAIAPAATLSAGDGLFAKSLLSVTDTNAGASDRLGIKASANLTIAGTTLNDNGTAIGTFTGGAGTTPLVVTFNANATQTAVLAVVENITFINTVANPGNLSNRIIHFQLTDGGGYKSALATQTVVFSTAAAKDAVFAALA